MGELKKGRYVYYHCTGVKGKCEEPYTREEVLEEYFGLVLKRLYFDDEVMEWIADALKQSHGDEKKYHGEAMARLQTEYNKLQGRIDAMYVDKLDGKIDGAFFEGKLVNGERNRIASNAPLRNIRMQTNLTWKRAFGF